MNDTEKFLFDLQGFLKVPDFLSDAEVNALNDVFDANADKRGEDGNRNAPKKLEGIQPRGMFTACSNGKTRIVYPSVIYWLTRN